ncbi:MAG TPA: glutamine-synthetase adenylyltransferase [Bryobacteraceae bacterium]|nr:glutamine-synthetase adenylyltransferase [Bryobacteraceae bacterium]
MTPEPAERPEGSLETPADTPAEKPSKQAPFEHAMDRLKQLIYRDRARAIREMSEISRALAPGAANRFDLLLASSPAPEEGLHFFARLREQQTDVFQRMLVSPQGLRCLIAAFTYSPFLSEEILQHPEWAEELLEDGILQRVRTAEHMQETLEASVPGGLVSPLELARFRRHQMLRILVRDVLGLAVLPEITGELTALADAILETALARIEAQLVAEFGTPVAPSGEEARFAVIALGKMGGNELNYSSDIDLLFLYSENGETCGPVRIANKEFFARVANALTDLLSTYTVEGMCYRVDLRLRPEGSFGEVCISLEGAKQYYAQRARDWELQMMIKARVAAGDRATGRALLDFVESKTYATSLDFSAIEELSATRERLNEKLAARQRARKPAAGGAIDVKLERGGIRDIEFLVQCLQRLYGGAEPWVRHGGTMLALARLQDKGFLSDAEYGRLAAAYQFLRHLEHRLQFADDRQTHTLPSQESALDLLARRMPGGQGMSGQATSGWLRETTRMHFRQVLEIYDRVVHASSAPSEFAEDAQTAQAANVVRALEQRAPRLFEALSKADLDRGRRAFEHFLERISADPASLERLDADPDFAARTLDLFEHSPYFAEELIRTPELVEEIARAADASATTASPPSVGELRRWYRGEMLRIQAASVCHGQPIFDTLARTSDLADAVVARAYEIAIRETGATHPPSDAAYRPADQMWVIALGRLGMREFDMASDADLVFVLADTDASELLFWTRVAERFVDLITAYTGEGVLFAVDTRLRPNGADGPLVQTESVFKDYFGRLAEAWEGIAYMKSRAVAGDPDRAEFFLHELQEIDWRRYGQGGRSRTDLKQMRMKIEREHGAQHPFKSGRGGYYDIDFILMYLRLKSAGVFFKVLNTPARIEVIQHMDLLDRATADFLSEAATFYRALDHGIRVLTGHAQDKLPSAEAQVEALGALLARWTPVPLDGVEDLQSRTRAVFEKIFG